MPQTSPITPTDAPTSCFDRKTVRGVGQSPTAAAAASILDQLQTSSRDPVALRDEAVDRLSDSFESLPFEHRGWHHVRCRVRDAMEQTDVPNARIHRFTHCGDETYVYQNSVSGEVEFHGSRCGDRFCLICGQSRSRNIARALEAMIAREAPLFITLTVRGKPGDSLATLIDRLSDGWKQLRRLDHWRKKIRGGAIMLEVKYSRTSGGHWHPHYHLMCHGDYIEKQWLSDAWKLITRDSDQVDVQRVSDLPKALGYVTKYASKPMDASFTMRPNLLCEAMRTLKGRRLCACFGTWYGTPLNDKPEEVIDGTEVLTTWRFVGTVRDLEFRSQRGDREAIDVLRAVERAAVLRLAFAERCRSNPPDPPQSVVASPDATFFELPLAG